MMKLRESLGGFNPPQTSAEPDEMRPTKTDVEKCYKRIADLEIRVHDLSTTTNMVG